jgi:hypothetical protein
MTPKDQPIIHEIYSDTEKSGYPSPNEQRSIIYKLESLGLFKITRENFTDQRGVLLNDIANEAFKMRGAKPKGFKLKMIEDKFNETFNKFKEKYGEDNNSKDLEPKLYITKRDQNYYFENNLIYIKNKKAQYVIVFDVVYSLKPNGGKIEYEKIITQCKKRDLKNVNKKSILRALTGNDASFFKYIKDIKQEPAYNVSLFVAMQNGKEIEFNNKK